MELPKNRREFNSGVYLPSLGVPPSHGAGESQGEITAPVTASYAGAHEEGANDLPLTGESVGGGESPLSPPGDVAPEPASVQPEAAGVVSASPTTAWESSVAASEETGTPVDFWLPQHPSGTQETDQEVRTVLLGKEQRTLSAGLLDKALAFNDALEEHNTLGHECTMFAYACMTDADVSQLNYNENSGLSLVSDVSVATESIDEILEARILNNMPAGTTLVILATDDLEQVSASERHFLVRSDTDNTGEPLYLSKIGSKPVVLSTIQAALTIYPSRAIGLVRSITPEMRDPAGPQSEER